MDVDAFKHFLRSGRGQAAELAPDDASLGGLGDDRVNFGDLLLDGEAGGREGVKDFGRRAPEVIKGWPLSGKQAAIDEVRGHKLVYDIEVPLGQLFQEAANECLVLLLSLRHLSYLLLPTRVFFNWPTP